MSSENSAYRRAGVDIDAQDEAIARIRAHVASTRSAAVLGDVGCFGGLFRPELVGVRDPVLVASTDGVGTKLKLAIRMGDYTTIGEDLVNHCINDILVQGALPLFFLDYISLAKLDPAMVESLISGMAAACRAGGCALLGGELAEMPGLYRSGDFDLAGFIVGLVDRGAVLPKASLQAGDVVYGLASSGLHTNGYSLAIRVLLEDGGLSLEEPLQGMTVPLGRALLAVHKSYLTPLRPLLVQPCLKGLAHITGGGLVDNLPRILPPACGVRIQAGSWPIPPLFGHIVRRGGIAVGEAFRVFNLGIGMAVVVDAARTDAFETAIREAGETAYRIGEIVAGDRRVQLEGAEAALFEEERS
ncbi:MAG: phosphoribosylformylglycinamidine cyclo-ligase [Planctomycetes bacterium]|nr:phosphoribosylformylglycinamidine cyclo-ligase [Planctomycetota bacterium]